MNRNHRVLRIYSKAILLQHMSPTVNDLSCLAQKLNGFFELELLASDYVVTIYHVHFKIYFVFLLTVHKLSLRG